MKFDAAQLKQSVTAKCDAKAKQVVESVLSQVVDSLMELSPVGQPEKWTMYEPEDDYTPGKYKANWVYSAGVPVYEYFNHEDDREDSFQQIECATGRLLKTHIKENKKLTTTHYFTNSVPYAQSVEYGLVDWQSKHNPQSRTFPIAVAGLTAQRIPTFVSNAKKLVKGVK